MCYRFKSRTKSSSFKQVAIYLTILLYSWCFYNLLFNHPYYILRLEWYASSDEIRVTLHRWWVLSHVGYFVTAFCLLVSFLFVSSRPRRSNLGARVTLTSHRAVNRGRGLEGPPQMTPWSLLGSEWEGEVAAFWGQLLLLFLEREDSVNVLR